MRNCFEVQFKQRDGKNKGSPMVAVSDQPEIFQLMKCAFEVSTARPRQSDDERSSSIANLENEDSKPKSQNALSKMVLAINSVPDSIISSEDKKVESTKNPSNVFSGIAYGTFSILKGVLVGAAGIVTEPVKGGMNEGMSGVAKGFGRGLIGVVAKPIGGVAGFVQCTVQGAINTPGTISKAVKDKPEIRKDLNEERRQ